jgi:hypothetical protein
VPELIQGREAIGILVDQGIVWVGRAQAIPFPVIGNPVAVRVAAGGGDAVTP